MNLKDLDRLSSIKKQLKEDRALSLNDCQWLWNYMNHLERLTHMTISEKCRETGVQLCFKCENLDCCDNTNDNLKRRTNASTK